MALKPVLLLLLWGLALFVHGVTSFCNVTCSTDYNVSLNCSCSGSVPTSPVLLSVVCRCSDEELEANGSCDVRPPQSWCVMYPENLYDVTSIGVMCTATASEQGDRGLIKAIGSSCWALSDVVKPLPPFDVQVTNTDESFNITWDHNNQDDCLTYSVCIREREDMSKDPAHSLSLQDKYILLDPKWLQPHVNYTVAVRAKMCPGNLYEGPWSEWSSSAEWRTTGNTETEGINGYWLYVLLSIILVFGLLLLGYLQKPYLQKKLQLITYIPTPHPFFKPFYHNCEGNFKEWVKPVFSESDYLRINSNVPMLSEKQLVVLQLHNEKQSFSEDGEMKPHSNSLLFFQDGGSSQGTGHSIGHISIHTVTLSGEEGFEEEVVSQSSVDALRSHQDGDSFGSEDPQLSRLQRQRGILPQHENQISDDFSVENVSFQPRAHLNEPERVSLDSFASNEQSEDGYPRVDLDTIDSGFGECSSPRACDSNTAEQTNSDLFHEHKSSNSNYVRQWILCSTVQENSAPSEDELQETHH